jgi:hypothetical protein
MVKRTIKKLVRRKKNNNKIKTQIGGLTDMNINNNSPKINDAPKIKDNIRKFSEIWLQVFNNVGMYTLDKVENSIKNISKSFGVDPDRNLKDEFIRLGQKAEEFNELLNTPEGKKSLSDLKKFFNKISKEVIIPSSQELAEGLIENVEPIMIKGQNAVFALLSASPFGALIDIPRFLSESLGVVEKSVTVANNVLSIGTDTIDKLKDEKENFNKVVSNFKAVSDNITKQTNQTIDSGLNVFKNRVDEYGKNIMENEKMNNENKVDKVGGKKLLKFKKESKIVGGRIIQSQTDFLSSNVKSLQNVKQYKTKRIRTLKRRLKSRKR